MKFLSYILMISLVLSACSRKSETADDTGSRALIIGDPLDYGYENMLIFPVGTSYKPTVYEDEEKWNIQSFRGRTLSFSTNKSHLNDRWAQNEYINPNNEDFDITNILFYSLETSTSYQLTNDTLHILSFALHKEFKNPLIFYRVVKFDLNKDDKYNAMDPVMLYVSKLNGDSLTRITPENEQFVDYFYYPLNQRILIKTIVDANNNNLFEANDETSFSEMNLSQPGLAIEIFSKDLKNTLRDRISQDTTSKATDHPEIQ